MKPRILAAVAAVCALAIVIAILTLGGGSHVRQSALGSVHPHGWGAGPNAAALAPETSVPTATMYDSVNVGEIPSGAFAAAGYTAGLYPTWPGLLRAFPRAHHISVAINASLHADCLDIEPYDASPSQAGAWAVADIKGGFRVPCLYGSLSEMPAIRASLAAHGLARSRYLLWLAWYRYVPGLVAGYDAVQWNDHAYGRNLDESTVSLRFLEAAQPPYVAPKPKPALPVCIHRRETRAACSAAKAKIASDNRAVIASRHVLNRAHYAIRVHHCIRPYRRGVCVHAGRTGRLMAHRIAYFTQAALAIQEAN